MILLNKKEGFKINETPIIHNIITSNLDLVNFSFKKILANIDVHSGVVLISVPAIDNYNSLSAIESNGYPTKDIKARIISLYITYLV